MKALWIAVDGTRHTVEGDSVHEIREKIQKLREQLDKPAPTLEHCHALTEQGKAECVGITNVEELPEHLKAKVKEFVQDQYDRPDPSKLN